MFKGEVVSIDEAAKTLVVKDKKGEKTFDVSMAKNMPELKAGDKVSFNYIEKDGKLMAGNFQKAGAKAPAKTEAAPISAGAPTPPPGKPAPAPAPASKVVNKPQQTKRETSCLPFLFPNFSYILARISCKI